MAERSFKKEVESLRLGNGEVFHGEGILAVTKALLQSGVSYVGGYQGAPVSHLMDVLTDAHDILDELGVHFETCGSEASAAAMLGASINYPMRGAVTWKSTVGTNVASDALSNVASGGVVGGTLIIIGEDYGEGASIMQERTHAFAMKSQIWLLDPRPNLTKITQMVEKGFELSEATSTPVMLEMRIRACHVYGRFETKDNVAPEISGRKKLLKGNRDYGKIILPPSTYIQEKQKVAVRWPKAIDFIKENKLNEVFDGDVDDIGIICQGGMYNGVIRALQQLGLSDAYGNSRIPIYCLNVTYPLVPEEMAEFCQDKRNVLLVEEGQPDYIEQAINSILRKADVDTKIIGKDVLPMAGEYTGEVLLEGVARFIEGSVPGDIDLTDVLRRYEALKPDHDKVKELLGGDMPARPPGFCIGCPERPFFSAMKMLEREFGELHVSSDIGCQTFSTLPPFNIGNTVLGYGLSLASSTGVSPNMEKRTISVMGDGGFWHNGLTSGVASAIFNKDDSVLVIVDNGYSAATGGQHIPSSERNGEWLRDGMSIEDAVKGVGAKWVRKVHTYDIEESLDALRDAMTTDEEGLKIIIAEGECQLSRQRRVKPAFRKAVADGKRIVRERFGVDEDVCTGDHSCIRLSGCPSLTIKPSDDPLKQDPVAYVDNNCVGCGVCGEVAHAAVLCPSFFRTEIINNPNLWDRTRQYLRDWVIGSVQQRDDKRRKEALI